MRAEICKNLQLSTIALEDRHGAARIDLDRLKQVK